MEPGGTVAVLGLSLFSPLGLRRIRKVAVRGRSDFNRPGARVTQGGRAGMTKQEQGMGELQAAPGARRMSWDKGGRWALTL